MMDELKRKASPYTELSEITKKLHDEQIITNNLLCQLCDLKEEQQKSDTEFRDAWKRAKIKDAGVSTFLVIFAGVALYLDVITFNPDGDLILGMMAFISCITEAISSLFNYAKGLM